MLAIDSRKRFYCCRFEEALDMLFGVAASIVVFLKLCNLVLKRIWFREYLDGIWQ